MNLNPFSVIPPVRSALLGAALFLLSANAQAFTVEVVQNNSDVNSVPNATAILDNPGNRPRVVLDYPSINFTDGGSAGNFGSDIRFPYNDRFAVRVTGSFTLQNAGTYTFGVNSDDGIQLRVNGNLIVDDDSPHAARNAFGATSLTAGTHSIEVVFWENGGDASLEVFIVPGFTSVFNAQTQLLTETPTFNGGGGNNASLAVMGAFEPVRSWPLVAVSMANLPDGRILTYSGSERRTWPSAERTYSATWDPVTDTFSEQLYTGHNMFCGTMTMLEDGGVFVAGGRNRSNSPWTSRYDYANDTWTALDNMASGGRWYPTTLGLGTGEVLTAMGVATNPRNPDLWSEDSGWRVLNGINFQDLRERHGNRNEFPLLSQAPNGDIYHFWDPIENHYVSTSGNGSATQTNATSDSSNHAGGIQVMYDEGKLLISGRNDGGWGGDESAFTIDLNGSEPVIQSTQDMNYRRWFHQLINLPNGEVLSVGGNSGGAKFSDSGSVFDTEIWNPETGTWRVTAALTVPRDYHSTALLMKDGRVITAGGGYHPSNPNSGGTHQDAQIFLPPYLFDSNGDFAARPTLQINATEVGYGQSFTASSNTTIDYFSLIKMSSTTHAVNTDARFFKPDFQSVGNSNYVITMHSNPNVATPGYWMLFAVDNNGVPSVAEVIQVTADAEDPNNGQAPIISEIESTPVEIDDSTTYTVNAVGNNLTYNWNFGDGTGDSGFTTQNSISHSFDNPGRYVVNVTVLSANGLESTESFTQVVYGNLTAQKPVSSGALVELTSRGELWNVNPDNNSVGIINTSNLNRMRIVNVGNNPRALAVAPSGNVWVVNKSDASISVINPSNRNIVQTISLDTGSKPHGIVFNSHSAYVALEGLGTVVQLNSSNGAERRRIFAGEFPRHLSLNASGNKLFVSSFITPRLPGEQGANPQVNGQGGEIRVYNTSANSLNATNTILLGHINRGISESQGPGLPNYLGPLVISPNGSTGWVPSKQDNILAGERRGGGGMTFDQTVRAVTSKVNLSNESENLFSRVDHDNASVASHAAFGPFGLTLFVSLEGNRQVALIDTTTGIEYVRFDTGRAPQSVLMSDDGTRLYVHNFMDRTVGVYDVSDVVNQGGLEVSQIATVSTRPSEQLANDVFRGKQFFYDARDDRMAALDYMSCASCHNEGGHDGRTWDFTGLGEGLRNTISLNGTGGTDHGLMHWSGNFDEVQDFEGQIRSFAGGSGLMTNAQFNAGSRRQPLGDPKAGVSSDLDALAAYVESLTEVLPSPYRDADGSLTAQAEQGKVLFGTFNCASCHAGDNFTDSSQTFVAHNIGTLDQDSGDRSDGPLTGFDTPTLLGVWDTAPYLHDGAALTIEDAIAAHSNIQMNNTQRANLAEYVLQIDSSEDGGGNTDGGTTDGGNADGGNTDGGNTDGGNTDGGNTDGGNTDADIVPGQAINASIAQGQWTYYTVGNTSAFSSLNITLTNLSADIDLYTRVGGEPNLAVYDCRPWNGGNTNELCNVAATDDVIIGVYGYRAGSYRLSVQGVGNGGGNTDGGTTDGGNTDGGNTDGGNTDGGNTGTQIAPGDTVSGSIAQGQWIHYSVTNSQGNSTLQAFLTNLNNDIDLYVREGSNPTTSLYDCRSWNGNTTNETCAVTASDTSIVGVYGYRAGNYTLSLSGTNGGGNTDGGTTDGGTTDGGTTDGGTTDGGNTDGGNTDGGATDGGTTDGGNTDSLAPGNSLNDSVAQGQWFFTQVSNQAGLSSTIATLSGLSADADLYVRAGGQPTLSNYDCRSWESGTSNESCAIDLTGATVTIGVYGYQASGFNLSLAGSTQITNININAVRNDNVALSTWDYYEVQNSQNVGSIIAGLSNMADDADLYLKVGGLPTLSDFDCRSYEGGTSDENCAANTNGDVVYIGVYGFKASSYRLNVNSGGAQ